MSGNFKVLKHKNREGIFGEILLFNLGYIFIDSEIPQLFPIDTTIRSLSDRFKNSIFDLFLEEFDLVEVTLNFKQ